MLLASLAVGLLPMLARAQANFPNKPIKLVVPFGPGMAPDIVARGLGDGLRRELGQPVVILNKPGAGGAIGYKYTVGQKPDGYSLVLNSNSVSTGFHGGLMPFSHEAFDAVARICVEFPVLAVRADSPFSNLKDMVDFVKRKPGELRVGSTSTGSHMHLTSVAFFNLVGGEVTLVPFATTGSITSLLGGHIDAVVTLPGSVSGQVLGGQAKVLGVLASAREPVFQNVKTATEQGFAFQSDLWRGIAAPKGLPPDVVAKLSEALRKIVTSAEFKQIGDRAGFHPAYLPPADFARSIVAEDAVIAAVLKKIAILPK